MSARRILVVLFALIASATSAQAERLVISLSTHQVAITSSFTGVDLTLFGAIEPDAASVGRVGGYTIITTVTGPRQGVITWRKERVLGIWVNKDSRTFIDAPSYLAVLTNRPVDTIAGPDALRRFQVGLRNFLLPQQLGRDVGDVSPDDEFRRAFVRVKTEHGLYREQPNAVTFLTPSLFRTGVPLPANAPVGEYEVDVKLFGDGVMLARVSTAFEIVKAGFEQYIAAAAREHGLLYGLATMMLALLTGWLGSVVFRRD
jgi:uncharacterized protein (TIGR02186 family)